MTARVKQGRGSKSRPPLTPIPEAKPEDVEPDWTRKCEVCNATPVVPATGMCGPCTFGEADTAEGNW